jgi:predicted peptidase
MKVQRLLLLTILCGVLTFPSISQTIIGRQKVDQFPTTWWGTMTYGLTWLPNTYTADTTTRYPLIVFLHGVGETGDGVGGLYSLLNTALPQTIANGWDPEAINPVDGQNYKFIVVSPQAPTAAGWSYQWNSIQYILPDIVSRYRVDTSRVYVTGLSAGGNGSWTCLVNGPAAARKFAAAVMMASAPEALDSIPKLGSQYDVKLWQICGSADAFYNFSINSTYAEALMPSIISQ